MATLITTDHVGKTRRVEFDPQRVAYEDNSADRILFIEYDKNTTFLLFFGRDESGFISPVPCCCDIVGSDTTDDYVEFEYHD